MNESTPAIDPDDLPEFGVKHYFRTLPLEPFSFARQMAFQRLGMAGVSTVESATMLVFMCLQTPERIDQARGPAECAAFRLEAAQWADTQKIGVCYVDDKGEKKGSKAGHEVRAIANAIWDEISKAEGEPELPKTGVETETGNA